MTCTLNIGIASCEGNELARRLEANEVLQLGHQPTSVIAATSCTPRMVMSACTSGVKLHSGSVSRIAVACVTRRQHRHGLFGWLPPSTRYRRRCHRVGQSVRILQTATLGMTVY